MTRAKVATGNCDEGGNYRVALPPGRYAVSSGGSSEVVEVKLGAWTEYDAILPIPSN